MFKKRERNNNTTKINMQGKKVKDIYALSGSFT